MTKKVQNQMLANIQMKKIGMGQQVVLALFFGVLCGLFFGELTTYIKFIGDIYVGLIQMMVLPYIIISLIGGIGKLTVLQAKQIVKYAIIVLLMMWTVVGTILVLLPFALPDLTSASFYSSSLVEPAKEFTLLNIYIPKNIFASLTNNQIPAVVIFCIAIGISLISVKEKQEVFKLFDVISEAVMRIITFVVRLTPVGVFTMTAVAAGTMGFEDLGRLQGYFILYTVAILIIGLWVLPGLIVSMTPFKYRDIITIAWSAMALSFAASKVLVALPLIIESIKKLFEKYEIDDPNAVKMSEMLVPIAYPFPNTGKLLSLFFIPFSAWFIGSKIPLGDYPEFMLSGLLSYFGNVTVAVPFLLDLMRLPADMFQIFLLTGMYCSRMSDALGAIDMFTFAVLVTCASVGIMRIQWRRVILILTGATVIILVSIISVRTYLEHVSEGAYDKDKVISSMQLMKDLVPISMAKATPNPVSLKAGQSRLERIKERGIIRIGYNPDRLPFSYTNVAGRLVGFDIEMAQHLAQELSVSMELVPFTFETLTQQLRDDHFDLAMSGVYGTVKQSEDVRLSDPYMFATMALVVPDYRDVDFTRPKAMHRLEKIRLGIHRSLAGEAIVKSTMADYPNVEFVILDNYRDFFEQKSNGESLDALYTGAESGSAWTLLYPNYQIMTPWDDNFKVPLVYPFSDDDNQMDEFIDHWVLLKQYDGTVDRAFEYWILGKGGDNQEPRWSVIRNVFGWI